MSIFALAATTAYLMQWFTPPPPPVPSVMATTPRYDAIVPAGPITLSVTYDRPMQPGSYSFVRTDEGAYPDCTPGVSQSEDGRTFAMQCQLRPGTHYVVWINRGRFMHFRDRFGNPAAPYRLTFSTQP